MVTLFLRPFGLNSLEKVVRVQVPLDTRMCWYDFVMMMLMLLMEEVILVPGRKLRPRARVRILVFGIEMMGLAKGVGGCLRASVV